jgi:two-component system cell cycle sensor histidine kinase/response regulator CckA
MVSLFIKNYLGVLDNGSGMDGETLRYIFEPFFSTKFAGRGLGLAEVEGIVRLHNGGIRIESEKGKGSVFEVFIPSGRGVPVQRDELKVDVKGDICFSGYVLVVDDDDAVRQSLKSMFTKLGMEVIVASNGEEALIIYKESRRKIDLVCADILMPKMDGIEIIREIRKIDRNQRAILISGYTGDRINLSVLDESITRFIKKPFEIQHLVDVISDLMGRSSK